MSLFKIEEATTGRTFPIRIDPSEANITTLKGKLVTFAAISPQDQILLIGPQPFKLLDKFVNADFNQQEGQRIFLYNRLIFAAAEGGHETEIPMIDIPPHELPKFGSVAAGPVPREFLGLLNRFDNVSAPLLDYYSRCSANVKRFENLYQFLDQILKSSIRCVEEQHVQCDALEAALNHFKDDFQNIQTVYQQNTRKLQSQQNQHSELLSKFDKDIDNLRQIVIVSSVSQLLKRERSDSIDSQTKLSELSISPGDMTASETRNLLRTHTSESMNKSKYSKGDVVTLYDCFSVEKEYTRAQQFRLVHKKIADNLSQLQAQYDDIMKLIIEVENDSFDLKPGEQSLENIKEFSRACKNASEDARTELMTIYNTLNEIVASEAQVISSSQQSLLSNSAAALCNQEEMIIAFEKKCLECMPLKEFIAKSKYNMTKYLYTTIGKIAVIQTQLQVMMERLYTMKKWYKGRNDYFTHLERISKFPQAYQALLLEIKRRQEYHSLFQSKIATVSESFNKLRQEETSHRKNFLSLWGKLIPTNFFDAIPSLVEKPPYFIPTGSEIPNLPQIRDSDVSKLQQLMSSLIAGNDSMTSSKSLADDLKSILDIDPEDSKMSDMDSDSGIVNPSQYSTTMGIGGGIGGVAMDEYNEVKYQNAVLQGKVEELTRQLSSLKRGNNVQNSTLLASTLGDNLSKDVQTEISQLPSETESIKNELLGLRERVDSEFETLKSLVRDRCDQCNLEVGSLSSNEELNNTLSRIFEHQNLFIEEWKSKYEKIENEMKIQQATERITGNMSDVGDSILNNITPAPLSSPTSEQNNEMLLSFTQFGVGNIALFLPRNNSTYIAFNVNSPHRYLSEESLAAAIQRRSRNPDYVLGRILFIDAKIALAESNPFELTIGTEYYLITVDEILSSPQKSQNSSRKALRGK